MSIVDLFDSEAKSFLVDSVRLSFERIQMKSYLKSKGVTLPLEYPFIPTYKIISEYNRVKRLE